MRERNQTDMGRRVESELARRLSSESVASTPDENREAIARRTMSTLANVLDYDVFTASDIIVDYAVMEGDVRRTANFAICREGRPAVIVKCVSDPAAMPITVQSRLSACRSVSGAAFSVATDGTVWLFHTGSGNRQKGTQDQPFFAFDFNDYSAADLEQLAAFTKDALDVGAIKEAVERKRILSSAAHILQSEFESPTPEFVRFVARRAHQGSMTESVLAAYAEVLPEAVNTVAMRVSIKDLMAALQSVSGGTDTSSPSPTESKTTTPRTEDAPPRRRRRAAPKASEKAEEKAEGERKTRSVRPRPAFWTIGDERHDVSSWYEVVDGLVKRYVENAPEVDEAQARLFNDDGALRGVFGSDPSKINKPVHIVAQCHRRRTVSFADAMRWSAALLDLMKPLPGAFSIEDRGQQTYRQGDDGAIVEVESAPAS